MRDDHLRHERFEPEASSLLFCSRTHHFTRRITCAKCVLLLRLSLPNEGQMQRDAGKHRLAAVEREQIATVVGSPLYCTGTTSTLSPLTAYLMHTEWLFGLI